MEFGITIAPMRFPVDLVAAGRLAEEIGFDSFWVPEHTHFPVDRRTPWPGGGEQERQWQYYPNPFVALAGVAGATKRIKLGTCISLVIQHDPIVQAKEVASLDHLSGGRFLFGIGGGWHREEMANHGTEPRLRWRVLRERIAAMKAIWTTDEAAYHGQLVNFDPLWSWPKPVQKPHPPILMGGDGPKAIEGLLEYCDGWMPRPTGFEPALPERMAEVARRAAELGRGPIPSTIFGAALDPRELERYEQLGAACALFRVAPHNYDLVATTLEDTMKVVREYCCD
jgi:probable F420-dependent oxidoreductase